ncbi:hypothetical protein Sps_04615 [Shewanella psychrophila]|uniref:TehB/YeaR-like domain-containing protein n=1 Tax=Shewanella psychrophila TaxID=225848 RepID=A0A1S6HVU6_9GAMM|nr:DUF1971 domain-containing protein [Shewanella psychrophila]AQS39700.1 hypothetical protein Sps_04615 [Shewanella psychrophila]
MSCVPKGYKSYKSSGVFTRGSIPESLAQPHFTKTGIYEQIHVLQGKVRFYGYQGNPLQAEKEVLIKADETAISHPNYWHKIEPLTDDTQFEVTFYTK